VSYVVFLYKYYSKIKASELALIIDILVFIYMFMHFDNTIHYHANMINKFEINPDEKNNVGKIKSS